MNSNRIKHIVQHNKRFLIIVLIPLLGLLVISLVEQFYLFTGVLAFLLLLSILDFRNEKLLYDDTGIVVCNIVKGPFFVPWSEIVLIERTSYYPFPSRLGYESLKIVYTIKGKTRIVRYDVFLYTGLPELLTFYYQVMTTRSPGNREED